MLRSVSCPAWRTRSIAVPRAVSWAPSAVPTTRFRADHTESNWIVFFERANLDHSIWIKYVRTRDKLADILTKRMFTTMQWHCWLTWWLIRRPCASNDVRSFSRKPLCCSALAKLQAMSQVMTQTGCVDQMWGQYESKSTETRLHSGQSLDLGAIEH